MNLQHILYSFLVLTALSFFTSITNTQAQGEIQMVRFSGIIVEGDSSYGVAGVHVYIPKAGRGTASNALGYFTMPAMEGDTVIISAVGYESVKVIIPKRGEPVYSVFIDLKKSIQELDEVVIFPYKNSAEFKDAVLALETSDPLVEQMRENLSQERLNQMVSNMPMSASANYRNFMQQQVSAQNNQFFAPTIPLLNPFAWAKFIKSIRDKDYKKPIPKTGN